MSSLNRAELIGNLGQDPEIRDLGNGRRVANFTVATTDKWSDKNSGERREKTEWHRVSVFNEGLVGVIEKWVKKGKKVFISGRLETRKWQDQNGNDRYTTEVILSGPDSRMIMLDAPSGDGNVTSANRSYSARAEESNLQQELDDEIPF